MQIRRKEQKADQSLSPWEATVKNKGPEIALKWKRKLSRPGKKNKKATTLTLRTIRGPILVPQTHRFIIQFLLPH